MGPSFVLVLFVHYLTVSLYSPFVNSDAIEHVLRVEASQANLCQISRGCGTVNLQKTK